MGVVPGNGAEVVNGSSQRLNAFWHGIAKIKLGYLKHPGSVNGFDFILIQSYDILFS